MRKLKLVLLAMVPYGLTACGAADSQTVFEDLRHLGKIFEADKREGVRVTQGYPVPSANTYVPNYPQTEAAVKAPAKTARINTTQCKDTDDWYLDGYRVGKSFASQKETMYRQRVNYCKGILSHADQFRQNWEKGFNVGVKKA